MYLDQMKLPWKGNVGLGRGKKKGRREEKK